MHARRVTKIPMLLSLLTAGLMAIAVPAASLAADAGNCGGNSEPATQAACKPKPPKLTKAEATAAAEAALTARVGDGGTIKRLKCMRVRRNAAMCQARGTAAPETEGGPDRRWRAKVRVKATWDGDAKVVTATIVKFKYLAAEGSSEPAPTA